MSSTKHSNLQNDKSMCTLLTNNDNNIGDICPPWGTPDIVEKVFDLIPNNLTHYCLLVKNEPNHERRGSSKPDASKTFSKILWLTVSNALDKSA